MPTYLVHGFRWNRGSIRIHIILQDLEDAAAEWLVAPATSITLLNSFYTLFDFLPPSNAPPPSYDLLVPHEKVIVQDAERCDPPQLLDKSLKGLRRISSAAMLKKGGKEGIGNGNGNGAKAADGEGLRPKTGSATTSTSSSLQTEGANVGELKKVRFNDWSVVKLLEQYDPDDMAVSQPYAYVADYMVKVGLSASIAEEIAKYEAKQKEEEALLSSPSGGSPSTTLESGSDGADGGVITRTISSLAEERRNKRLNWFEKLRDGLEKDGEIGWYVVVCGDEERAIPSIASESDLSLRSDATDPQKTPTRSGLRKFFSRKKVNEKHDN